MKNRLTFENLIKILSENKKKTYPEYRMVPNIFYPYLDDPIDNSNATTDEKTQYSKWKNGARPVPTHVVSYFEEKNLWDNVEDNFNQKIIPNLINISQARVQMESLLNESKNVIGTEKIQELKNISDHAAFFASLIRYAVLNDHSENTTFSPDLSETLLSGRVPSCTKDFLGRKKELTEVASLLRNSPLLFISGIAGIGKSEFVKYFAKKNEKKYTNIIYMHYNGSLKKSIASLQFISDTSKMTESELFNSHYKTLQTLWPDSLIILDNFNVLPKDDAFFSEFIKNKFQLIITTRCKVTIFDVLQLKELDKEKELKELFFSNCPSSSKTTQIVSQIIDVLNAHTLTVSLASLTLEASGMDIKDFLHELKDTGIRAHIPEEVELYKDDTFSNGRMLEHLHKLLELSRLSEKHLHILRNLCLLPTSGVPKVTFKEWLNLESLNDVNHLIRYGFISEDTENKTLSLHPLIQELSYDETVPTMSACSTLLQCLYSICIAHGLEVRRSEIVIQSLISVIERIHVDIPTEHLFFLQNAFPYFEKYRVMDYLPVLVKKITEMMDIYQLKNPHNKALLLDYEAELLMQQKDYSNALQKRLEAIQIIKPVIPTNDETDAALYSNLHNNLSNTYLSLENKAKAYDALKTAFEIRNEHAHLGLIESHDTLQQIKNLVIMLINDNNLLQARNLLSLYENLVREYEGNDCLDYGTCQVLYGILYIKEKKLFNAEDCLLHAEKIISKIIGTDNDYIASIHQYLALLYTACKKPELAEKYSKKLP